MGESFLHGTHHVCKIKNMHICANLKTGLNKQNGWIGTPGRRHDRAEIILRSEMCPQHSPAVEELFQITGHVRRNSLNALFRLNHGEPNAGHCTISLSSPMVIGEKQSVLPTVFERNS